MPAPPVHTDGSSTRDEAAGRWRMLAVLSTSVLLGMSLWLAASAVAFELALRWDLSPSEVGWFTSAVQLGFVTGTATLAVLNLGDLIAAPRLFAVSAVVGGVVNALLLVVPSYELALVTRFATGFALAGVYPPAMKMAATWFRGARGLAIGSIVGALTIGKATPYLVHAFEASAASVILSASIGATIAAALLTLVYREGPYPFTSRPFHWGLVGEVVRERRWRLATGGYLGHMWELYAMWAWIPVFLIEMRRTHEMVAPNFVGSWAAFPVIAIGALGCVWGGWYADHKGRERLVTIAMAVSGLCALVIGPLSMIDWLLGLAIAIVWGFFVIADSAQFSTMVTESVPPHAVGTALMVQTSVGFLLTLGSIQLIPVAVEWIGWKWAFGLLAVGPVLGIESIRRLKIT